MGVFAREKNVEKVGHRDITPDPREQDDWFLRMPAEAQEEMRERWRAEQLPPYRRVWPDSG